MFGTSEEQEELRESVRRFVTDRAPLSVSRLEQEFGWRARFGCAESAVDLNHWWMQHQEGF